MSAQQISSIWKILNSKFCFALDEDLPIFPIDPKILKSVRERVRLAREIEGIDLQVRRQNDNRNWKKKAAEDIGILDSEDS